MPARTLDLEFPAKGIDKRLAAQNQKPFTTPYCVNVRPFDAIEQRRRGGSRPDLVKAFPEQLGSGAKVNLLDVVRQGLSDVGDREILDEFGNTSRQTLNSWNSTYWEGSFDYETFVGPLAGDPPPTPIIDAEVLNGLLTKPNGENQGGGLLQEAITNLIDANQPYSFSVVNATGAWLTKIHAFDVWLGMDSVPSDSSSLRIRCTRGFGDSCRLTAYLDGAEVATTTGVSMSNYALSATVTPTGFGATFGDISLSMSDVSGMPTGTRILFISESEPAVSNNSSWLRVDYKTTSAVPEEVTVAAAGGLLYKETPAGTMTSIGTSNSLTLSSDPIESATRLGVLYIADYAEPRAERTVAHDDANIADNTTYGTLTDVGTSFNTAGSTKVIAGGDVIEITASQSGGSIVALGWYIVTAVISDTELRITKLDGSWDTGLTNTHTAYRIVPGLKQYSLTDDELTLWTPTSNDVDLPYGCRHITKHLDRIVLAGDPNNDSTIYFSTQGNPGDFTEAASDVSSAYFTGSATGLEQDIGVAVTGIYEFSRDYMIINTAQDIWLMRGDFRQGGSMTRLSGTVGMVSGRAFVIDDTNTSMFLSRNGLYQFTGQAVSQSSDPDRISKERLPKELRGVSTSTHSVTMGYNPDEDGIYLWITPLTAGNSTEYFLEPQSGAFIPDSLDGDHQVFSSTYLGRTNTMLVGCRDGYIRKYDPDGGGDDDGVARTQEVDYGPIPLNRGNGAMAESIVITLDNESSDVTWEFRSGQTAEEAFNATVRATGTASAGLNYVDPINEFGTWGFLRLTTSTAAKWAVEDIKLSVLPAAPERKF